MQPIQAEEQSNKGLYLLLGCAGLIVTGLCVATGVGFWMMGTTSSVAPISVPVAPTPVPVPPVAPPNTGPGPALPPPPGPALPPPPAMGVAPRIVTAVVGATTGAAPVATGSECTFTVERHSRAAPPGYWCRTQINCGGNLLYGGPTAGFFECSLYEQPRRNVVGEDTQTTTFDSDAAMRIDTTNNTVTVRDDTAGAFGEFTVDFQITNVR